MESHVREIASIDFLVVPTAAFALLFVFMSISGQRGLNVAAGIGTVVLEWVAE